MLWLENQTILLVFSILCALVTSDIYKSVMWTTNNPLFSDSGKKLSPCFGYDLEMRVHLQSSLPIVCPFDFIIMKTLSSKPATGVLYENFWIVYDEPSFHRCDINMTYKDGKNENKKLLVCDSPEALKSFTYSIDFKANTPANSGIAFVGGRYYYFLATSDGTDGSLNNTKGGHCDDPKVRMKFKVYICKPDDEKCQNVSIGEFFCSPNQSATTTSPPSTVPVPSSPPSNVTPCNTTMETLPTPTNKNCTVGPSNSTTTGTTSCNSSFQFRGNGTNSPTTTGTQELEKAESLGSQDILKELSRWKTLAIVSICLLVALIIAIIVCYLKRPKEKPSNCFTDIYGSKGNKVTPPGSKQHSPEYDDRDIESNMKHSYNNSNFDSKDGKNEHKMTSFNHNINPAPAVDKSDIKQTQNQNDTQDKEPKKLYPVVNGENMENETPGRKENDKKRHHRHKHEDNKDKIGNGIPGGKDRHSKASHFISLPPLEGNVVSREYSPRTEKSALQPGDLDF